MSFLRKAALVMGVMSFFLALFTGHTYASEECNITMKKLFTQIPLKKDTRIIKQKLVASGICEVIAAVKTPYGLSYLPIYYIKQGKGAIIGAYFKNRQNITNTEISRLREADLRKAFEEVKKILPSLSIAEYKPKNANGKTLYVFVDPLCPYCHAVEKHLKGLADKSGYTVELIPFIVHGRQAEKRTESFICENKTFNDWINNNFGKGGDKCSRAGSILKRAAGIIVKLHLSGTPTFVTDDGKIVEGANMFKLKKILGLGGTK